MNDAVPDGGRLHLDVAQKPADTNDCFPWAGNGTSLGKQYISTRILCMEFAAFIADRLSLTRDQPVDPRGSNTIQSEFERRRAAVQRKYI